MELAEESRDFTCFNTHLGMYRYTRSPMGLIDTGDNYNMRVDKAIEGLERTIKVVDDTLIASRTYEEHVKDVRNFMERCKTSGITLNKDKFIFAADKVKFAGYIVSKEGREVDPDKVKAIREFASPTTITELRSFMGLVNQLGSFSKDISEAAEPLRDLLRTRNEFMWTANHQEAFQRVKEQLIEPPILATFDPKLETRLETDASRTKGLGFSLLQKHGDQWKLVNCGSRFLADVETRYPMVELEAIAIKYGIKKCHLYLYGIPHFTVITDHRPLKPIFNEKNLSEIENVKLQNLKAALKSQYQFTVDWRKGKEHAIADALSHAPVDDGPDADEELEDLRTRTVKAIRIAGGWITDENPMAAEDDDDEIGRIVDPIIESLREAARADEKYRILLDHVKKDAVGDRNAPPFVRQYKAIRENLGTDGDLVLYGTRVVIPESKRKEVLKSLHAAHQGIGRTRERARRCVYWPGISNEIAQMNERCNPCQEHLPSLQKETLMADPLPTRPFESVSADLFACRNHHFLVYADRYSGYPMVEEWRNDPTAKQVIEALSRMMQIMGYPCRFRSDGGPQFKAVEFQRFLERRNIVWGPSSPYFPSSNGHAEVFVKKVKTLIKKLDKPISSEEFC